MSASASYPSPRNPFAGAAPLAYRPLSAIAATAAGGVPQARIKRVLAELVAPIQALHDQGLIRGDISVHTVGLDETGRAHLIVPGYGTEPTPSGAEAGYAPPELSLAGPRWPRGPWTDIYALSAVAHSLVTGMPPPPAGERVAADRYLPLADRQLSRYDTAFLHALDVGLALDPRDRPQTLQEFAQLLDIPVSATLAPSEPLATPSVPSQPAMVDAGAAGPGMRSLLLALLVLAVGAGVGVYWWHRLTGPQNTPVITWSGAAPAAVPSQPAPAGQAAPPAAQLPGAPDTSPGTVPDDPAGASAPVAPAPAETPAGGQGSAEAPADADDADETEAAQRAASIASPAPWVRVRVDIQPWGEIWIDGVKRGVSPPLKELRLPPGQHNVVVRNADLPAYQGTLTVREGKPTVLRHTFR